MVWFGFIKVDVSQDLGHKEVFAHTYARTLDATVSLGKQAPPSATKFM